MTSEQVFQDANGTPYLFFIANNTGVLSSSLAMCVFSIQAKWPMVQIPAGYWIFLWISFSPESVALVASLQEVITKVKGVNTC